MNYQKKKETLRVSDVSTFQGTWVSMGVYSDGSYGVEPGIIYSFPVTCDKGKWTIVQGKFFISSFSSFLVYEECATIF